jgi:hypothetical protein
MLETGEIYLATTDIARDTYSVCQVLPRAFKQYKNGKWKFYLRRKDCGLADCFIVEARSILIEGCTLWKICKVNLSFHCTRKTEGRNRHYITKQLLAWGIIPTEVAFVPTSAGGRISGGQVKQLGLMVKHTDGVALKRTQLSALLKSYLELDLKEEVDAIERRMLKIRPPISAYMLESKWESLSLDGIEMPIFMFTTGY